MRISHALAKVTAQPPWFVRLFGVALLAVDTFWWLKEFSPTTLLEITKHGILLAIGLSMFYPEGLILVGNTARRLPFLNRRTQPREGPPTSEHGADT